MLQFSNFGTLAHSEMFIKMINIENVIHITEERTTHNFIVFLKLSFHRKYTFLHLFYYNKKGSCDPNTNLNFVKSIMHYNEIIYPTNHLHIYLSILRIIYLTMFSQRFLVLTSCTMRNLRPGRIHHISPNAPQFDEFFFLFLAPS